MKPDTMCFPAAEDSTSSTPVKNRRYHEWSRSDERPSQDVSRRATRYFKNVEAVRGISGPRTPHRSFCVLPVAHSQFACAAMLLAPLITPAHQPVASIEQSQFQHGSRSRTWWRHSINALVWTRGMQRDYHWGAENGAKGWARAEQLVATRFDVVWPCLHVSLAEEQ
jgi:hypothetical protein